MSTMGMIPSNVLPCSATSSYVTTSPRQSNLRAQLTSRPHSVLVKDPNLLEDPEAFNFSCCLTPQRVAGNWNGKVDGDLIILFGFGPRVCPDMHLAPHVHMHATVR